MEQNECEASCCYYIHKMAICSLNISRQCLFYDLYCELLNYILIRYGDAVSQPLKPTQVFQKLFRSKGLELITPINLKPSYSEPANELIRSLMSSQPVDIAEVLSRSPTKF